MQPVQKEGITLAIFFMHSNFVINLTFFTCCLALQFASFHLPISLHGNQKEKLEATSN